MADNQVENLRIRFKQIRDSLRLGQEEFAELVGIKQSHVSSIETGKRNITGDIKLSLQDNVGVNRHWLETGVGEMFLQKGELNADKSDMNYASEPRNNYNIRIIEPQPQVREDVITDLQRYISTGHEPIPVYDDTDDLENIDELINNPEKKPVVLLMKGHLGCNAVVRHNDSAMDKHFPPKCQLGIQRVNNFRNRIIPGMAAIIELEDFTITRYVFEADNKDELLLRSADPESFPDMKISVAEIKTIWKIKSVTPVAIPKILMY